MSPFAKIIPPPNGSAWYPHLWERFRAGFGRAPDKAEDYRLVAASWSLAAGRTVALRNIRGRLMVQTMPHPDDCVDLFCEMPIL